MSDSTQNPQAIIDLILSDINGIIPTFSALVNAYRLLVGAAEEIQRTPNICPEVFERAVHRLDNTGTLIDVLLELLCCKIAFSSEFLRLSCAPVDLLRLLANSKDSTDPACHTAEQVLGLEILRRALSGFAKTPSCLPDQPVICPETPANNPLFQQPVAKHTGHGCEDIIESEILWPKHCITKRGRDTEDTERFRSHLRLKHLPAWQKPETKNTANKPHTQGC